MRITKYHRKRHNHKNHPYGGLGTLVTSFKASKNRKQKNETKYVELKKDYNKVSNSEQGNKHIIKATWEKITLLKQVLQNIKTTSLKKLL